MVSTIVRQFTATRFAPSPTGYLHLGHVASAIYVWGIARHFGAKVILRIEDHDMSRCRQDYVDQTIKDLDWLGFHADTPVYRQSAQSERYERARQAIAQFTYACQCSRKDSEPSSDSNELRYPGTCRKAQLAAEGRVLRVVVNDKEETFTDGLVGLQSQNPWRQCGDFAIRDRLGQWTYQFAVVVDDIADGIDLIVRGQDLLASTGRQIYLARLLGRNEPPQFFHHPLLLDEQGAKLSKRQFSEAIGARRDRGASATELLGEAALYLGLISGRRQVNQEELAGLVASKIGLVVHRS